jgi:hypothetical protein
MVLLPLADDLSPQIRIQFCNLDGRVRQMLWVLDAHTRRKTYPRTLFHTK